MITQESTPVLYLDKITGKKVRLFLVSHLGILMATRLLGPEVTFALFRYESSSLRKPDLVR